MKRRFQVGDRVAVKKGVAPSLNCREGVVVEVRPKGSCLVEHNEPTFELTRWKWRSRDLELLEWKSKDLVPLE